MLEARSIKKRDILVLVCILAVMMIIGSVWDYPISVALYDQTNAYGIFFAAFGEYPSSLGLVLAGALLFAARNREKKSVGVFQLIAGALLVTLGTVFCAMLPGNYLEGSKAVYILLGVLCSAAVVFLTFRHFKNADRKTVIRLAAMLFTVIIAEMVLVNIIKIPWGRARMRLVAEDARAAFMPWWDFGSNIKKALLAEGVAAEEFKSFPSGHTANAACLMLLAFLPRINNKLAGKETLLFFISVAWGLMVALSRIIMGAHYVTDTVVGFGVTLAVVMIAYRIFFSSKKQTISQ